MRYWLGVDFGQANDPTAIAVVERVRATRTPHELHVRDLVRPPLRTPYERIAEQIAAKVAALEPTGAFGERGEIGLCVDATGVGRAVCEMVKTRLRSQPGGPKVHFWPVVVTGGNSVTRNGEFVGVPKRDLINSGLIALQERRLKIPTTIQETEILKNELLNYRVRITLRSGHDSYEPWREGDHDDLLFALCLSTWAFQHTQTHGLLPASSVAGA